MNAIDLTHALIAFSYFTNKTGFSGVTVSLIECISILSAYFQCALLVEVAYYVLTTRGQLSICGHLGLINDFLLSLAHIQDGKLPMHHTISWILMYFFIIVYIHMLFFHCYIFLIMG